MKKVLGILILFISVFGFSQNALQFAQVVEHDTLIIYQKDKINLSYIGYLNQEETKKGKILLINDTAIVIGNSFLGNYYNKKTILISDIQGVRKYSKFRQIAKFSVNVIIIAGSILLPEALGITSVVGIYSTALGASFVGLGISTLIFPDKIKISKRTGWDIKILYPVGLK
jgi:hypothetical protein